MFKLPSRPGHDSKPIEKRRYFWTWFLTNAIVNLVDIENMPPDMETNFKIAFLIFGRVLFFRDKSGELRALYFADGGKVPIYPGQIVSYLVTNPVIGEYRFNADSPECKAAYLTMLDRCQMGAGYSDLVRVFSNDLAENDVSINMVQILKRLPIVFRARTDGDKEAATAVIQAISDGRPEIVAQTALSNLLERMDGNSNGISSLSEFTEYQQYKLGLFYGILGVNTVWNMKRERVAAAENATNAETARYNINDIIDNLNQQLEEVNAVFQTDFHARLNVEKMRETDETTETETEPETTETTETEEGAENG